MDTLVNVIRHRDGSTVMGATLEVVTMAVSFLAGEDPEEVLFDEHLEPDYVMDLLEWSSQVAATKVVREAEKAGTWKGREDSYIDAIVNELMSKGGAA